MQKTTPNFQLTAKGCEALLKANGWNFALIEDHPNYQIHFVAIKKLPIESLFHEHKFLATIPDSNAEIMIASARRSFGNIFSEKTYTRLKYMRIIKYCAMEMQKQNLLSNPLNK